MPAAPVKRSAHQAFPGQHNPEPNPAHVYTQQPQQQHIQQPPQNHQQPLPQVPPTPQTPAHPGGGSSSKKRTSGASSRTGQACDRCKARKIRCDDTLGGCMPCRQNHTECTTTDRITNRAQVRGHTEAIEQEAAILRQQVDELRAQLKEHNIEPRVSSFPLAQPWAQPQASAGQLAQANGAASATGANPFSPDPSLPQEANMFAQTFAGSGIQAGTNRYIGMSMSNLDSAISPATGLSLSVFGMNVDLAQFVPEETNHKLSTMSWDHLYNYVARGWMEHPRQPPRHAQLPTSYDECVQFCRIYLTLVNPFLPLLDKTDFMNLVAQFYSPQFRPDAAQQVMLHMVLATIKFHKAYRNLGGGRPDKESEAQYRAHLEFSLQHVSQLTSRRSLVDIQALALIIALLRILPTPHACYFMTHWVTGIIIDMGLHRSASSRGSNVSGMTSKEIEMRKRVFWSILAVMVSVSGKLGRPIELHGDDFDIEFPEVLDDMLPNESAKTPEKRCSFSPGIEGFRLVSMFQDTYNALYIVKPSADYEMVVKSLEARQKAWRDRLPNCFRLGRPESEDPENRMFALWLAYWDAEIQLLLHHPAVCRSVNPQIISTNMQHSVEASRRILEIVAELRKAKSNDSSWLNASTYIAAIFTLLFAFNHRKDELLPPEINTLQSQLEACYGVLEDVGIPLGTGRLLPERVQRIVNPVLSDIKAYVENKNGYASGRDYDAPRYNAEPTSTQQRQAAQALQTPSQEDQKARISPHSSSMTHQKPMRSQSFQQSSQQQQQQQQKQQEQQTRQLQQEQQRQFQQQQEQQRQAQQEQQRQQQQQEQQQQIQTQPQMQQPTPFQTNYSIHQAHIPYHPNQHLNNNGMFDSSGMPQFQGMRIFQGAQSNPAHARAQQQAYLNHLNSYYAWNDMSGPPSNLSQSLSNNNNNVGSPAQWNSFAQNLKPSNPPSSSYSNQQPQATQQSPAQQTPQSQHTNTSFNDIGTANTLMTLQGSDPSAAAQGGGSMSSTGGGSMTGQSNTMSGSNGQGYIVGLTPAGFPQLNQPGQQGAPWPMSAGFMGGG